MGQQPNIAIDMEDLPRRGPEPGVPGPWKPSRPGEITGPEEMPVGGLFGNPSPDTGWVLRLVRRAEFDRGSRPEDLERVAGTVAGARASAFGRGPTPEDVEAALTVLGLRPEGLSSELVATLTERRATWLRRSSHEVVKGRSVLEEIDRSLLVGSLEEIRAGLGERFS
jgi:hypothetical protein